MANVARLLFWSLLVVMLLSQWIGTASLERKRSAIIEEIQKTRGSRVITLIHREETVNLLGMAVSKYIDIDDAEAVLRAIRLTPPKKPIDLIVHTPGGLVLAASQITHALRAHEGKITVLIPHYAMSGGTLIALAADEIIMDPNAVLGPVDPQIGDLPAASIIRAVELKKPEHVDDRTLILADMSSKAITQVTSLVSQLLEKHLPREKAKEVAALISTGQFTHDFPITVERAKSVGLPISTETPPSIYQLMDLYPQRGAARPSVNYVPLPKSP
ncbi:MAG: ATP-dependent Clp protease proteolytic subunit [Deltaproteobacteria bacterium]|nr:MAG: ATP-dependent Clp protease proteolytic subunit [Deltaproteobacteria bacterium]